MSTKTTPYRVGYRVEIVASGLQGTIQEIDEAKDLYRVRMRAFESWYTRPMLKLLDDPLPYWRCLIEDNDDRIVEFTWEDLAGTLGESALDELTEEQQRTLAKCFTEGICNGWTEVAEIALDAARAS